MSSKNEHRVLVLSGEPSDAEAVCTTAAEAGILAEQCRTIEGLCSGILTGAGAAVVGQEVLSRAASDELMATLANQPAWSDFPVILVAFPTGGWRTIVEDILGPSAGHGNFVVVQRPLNVDILVTAIRAVLRARSRQYELRRSHELLGESEARFRALVTACSEVLYRMSPDWSEMRQLSGGHFLANTDTPSRDWLQEYVPPDEQSRVMEAINHAIRNKSTFELEHRVRRVGGSISWMFSRAIPMLDANGEIVEWFGAASDVTRRKEAEEALREGERQLRELADSMPQLVWIADHTGSITYANRQWSEQIGLPFDQALGDGWSKALHPEDVNRTLTQWRRCVQTAEPCRIEYRMRMSNGDYRWRLARAVPIRDAQGRITHWYGTSTDIDETKRAEERLRQAQKLESIGTLAGGVAHDFNNLLTVIMGSASAALQECPSCERSEAILSAAERAADLTKQLLAYAGKGQIVRQNVDISELVLHSRQLLEASIPKRVNLIPKLAKDLPAVEDDPSRIEQILMNLVINAGEAIEPKTEGRIDVSTGVSEITPGMARLHSRFDVAAGVYVWLEVQDNGAGMDEATLSRIFDPFFSTKFTGRGLGLAAVDGIVRSGKGFIDVRSSPNRGTTFRVFFPASEKKRPVEVVAPVQRRPAPGSVSIVLVVDDEEMVRMLTGMILRRHGYEVLEARDGKHALQVLADCPSLPSAALVDLAMPVLGGDELVPILAVQYPELKVILTSGFPAEEMSRTLAGSSVAGFLQKPYTAATLTDKVDEILGRESQRPGHLIQFPSSA